MAILDYNSFQAKLNINNIEFDTSDNIQSSRSIGGLTYRVSRGPKIWTGTITLSENTHLNVQATKGLIQNIRNADNYFIFSPDTRYGSARPATWKASDVLTNVKTNGTQAAGYSLKLKGLPANYVLTHGDYLSFTMSGAHRLYQITEAVTASGTGTVTVKVNIPLMAGALPVTDTVVRLVQPFMTAAYADNSYSGGAFNVSHADSLSFSFQQVIRV